ncbi:MAG: solute/DNA competence effector protein [Osedax symbiont Rs2]|nr:MAG: solute/DNA competence effector protein [Osedax symbiont Rs2]
MIPEVTKTEKSESDKAAPSKNKAKNRAGNQAALALLIETYPETFSRTNIRPLKIGIQDDLIADEKVAKNKIKRALASYVRAPNYFRAMKQDTDRIDLAGESAGKVSESEAEYAKVQLKEFHQRRRENQRRQEKEKRDQEKDQRLAGKLEMLLAKKG